MRCAGWDLESPQRPAGMGLVRNQRYNHPSLGGMGRSNEKYQSVTDEFLGSGFQRDTPSAAVGAEKSYKSGRSKTWQRFSGPGIFPVTSR